MTATRWKAPIRAQCITNLSNLTIDLYLISYFIVLSKKTVKDQGKLINFIENIVLTKKVLEFISNKVEKVVNIINNIIFILIVKLINLAH